MPIETLPWDAADYLKSPEDELAYLEAAVEDGDPRLVAAALGDIARARGMSQIAKEAGLARPALYRALSEDGDPRLSTLLGVAKTLGLKLSFRAA
jgi:probable addiction module antidote protein